MESSTIKQLLQTEDEQTKKLHSIVLKAIEEEKLLSQKLVDMEDLHPPLRDKLADHVARLGGSWSFIGLFGGIMVIWIAINVYWLRSPFDPYPFILLNLILSTVAALQAPIIMMSQNRKEEKDRTREVNDYLINLKAEIEIRNILDKLDLLMEEQMKTLFEIQKEQVKIMEEIRQGQK